ncbi:hypothetical protein [Mesorhizobium sp.]|uniref:hypothetical protein n=1 Tax=Mesorhizobium sp. TaxID=1871066 RepID=UPI000FE739BB|nr:hypothetical protein [Mesorhizobium sp.]RWB28020.1 MAG: hypothetical protein EOQ43_25005 [Mesorhizobium sp.]RWE67271.1 MAG: hypothetical protein EOS62_15890 [Mesorhizobium sp.]RWI14464.1 MAG: hypothetical protein EOQ92_28975 [Mesorhizobium sp.]RWK32892.1 MAG: hypothetical protein EOR46_30040 [Mesorhizobium sp.]RWK90115.1 MAG: hypothetical protein EOR53_31245 [Mesorhizobium sp.]
MKEIWSALFERGLERNLEVWADRVIELEDAFKDLWEIADTFGKTELTNRVIASLAADFEVFRRVRNIPDIEEIVDRVQQENDHISPESLAMVHSVIADNLFEECQQAEPRLYGTWDLVIRKLKDLNATDLTLDAAKAERGKGIERHFAVKRSYGSFFPPEPDLPGWRDYTTVQAN